MATSSKEQNKSGLTSVGDLLHQAPDHLQIPSATEVRLIESSVAISTQPSEDTTSYQHTVFCQTALPYRQVNTRVWERSNGQVSLRVEAGSALHPESQQWIDLPLPFGPKARLIMIHLDTQAILTQSPTIELDDSMTAFVKKLQGRSPTGPELRKFKDQAAAIAGALFRFAAIRGEKTFQLDNKVVKGFELWYPKNERQRTLWPSIVELSPDYFETLVRHAVPMDHRAVMALAHNALALDIYKWLSQRLCRVHSKAPSFIPWPVLQLQFGQGYARVRKFREVFILTLRKVLTQYSAARIEHDEHGVTLYQSRPPIAPRTLPLPKR